MNIQEAEWTDILPVLHQTFKIWSAGLKPDDYYSYTSFQINHPWSRKNYRYMVYRHGCTVVSSCKLYSLELTSHGKIYSFAGLGAVFTGKTYRGLGYGRAMLSQIIELCRRRDVKGLLLFSDIGPDFYNKLGFNEVSAREFAIYLPEPNSQKSEITALKQALSSPCHDIRLVGLENKHIAWLNQLYTRWLRRQPYGVLRSDQYWHYKLAKEQYLHSKSQWQWPRLELAILESGPQETGYAIFEYSTKTLRALEVIGPSSVQLRLWRGLLLLALQRGARRIRGWEGSSPIFLRCRTFTARDWGIPMILSLCKDTQAWTNVTPCPILELDHL